MGTDGAPAPDDRAEAGVAGSPPPLGEPGVATHQAELNRIKSSHINPRIMAIVPEFVASLPSKVGKMTDLLQRSDLPGLQALAHQLLGTCGGYGFAPVSEPARTVEQSVAAGRPLESITLELKALIEVIRRIDGYDKSKEAVLSRSS